MMKMILLLVIVATLASNTYADGGLPYNKITSVAFNTAGFFLYADNWPNPNSCSNTTAVVLLDSDVNYDKAYSLLLTAYISGKEVTGYSDGCTTFDGQTYNTIRGFKYLSVK